MAGTSKKGLQQEDELQHATERAEQAEAEAAQLREQLRNAQTSPEISSEARESHSSGATRESASGSKPERTIEYEKSPPSPSSAGDESRVGGGEEELRRDSMMAHLLDSLAGGQDIGHYGRLVFAMVARHFLTHEEVIARLTNDRDFSQEDAELMLRQTEGRDYSPPRRERIVEWQSKQDFPILPNPDDPDCGNLYRNLKFPEEVYRHIGHYQEEKMHAGA